ncbi:MAG: hypothetical protein ACI9N1_000300 [Flavobacteriales bacterium]|jgi:hypothetical protein
MKFRNVVVILFILVLNNCSRKKVENFENLNYMKVSELIYEYPIGNVKMYIFKRDVFMKSQTLLHGLFNKEESPTLFFKSKGLDVEIDKVVDNNKLWEEFIKKEEFESLQEVITDYSEDFRSLLECEGSDLTTVTFLYDFMLYYNYSEIRNLFPFPYPVNLKFCLSLDKRFKELTISEPFYLFEEFFNDNEDAPSFMIAESEILKEILNITENTFILDLINDYDIIDNFIGVIETQD